MLNKIKKDNQTIHSLRSRVIIFFILISLLIVSISAFSYSNIKTFHEKSIQQIQQRSDLLITLSFIRGKLLDSYKDLNDFLLTPENNSYKKQTVKHIKEASEKILSLENHPWIKKYRKEKVVNILIDDLHLLSENLNNLIDVRLDSNNQYPSLAVAAAVMEPNRDQLNDVLAFAILEAGEDNTQIESPEVYRNLIELRYFWTRMILAFRGYLANRVGSFNRDALPSQEKTIGVLFQQFKIELSKLKASSKVGKLGFETEYAIPVIMESSQMWFKGFNQVKIIHHSDEWRRDAKIMRTIISPQFDTITKSLIILEKVVDFSAEEDIKLFYTLREGQNKILWMIAFLGLFFTGIIILSLDKLIFKPISLVSKALKLEALGEKSDDIVIIKTKETEELVNAFSEMSYQVHQRQKELEYRALHDTLTSLPNRALLLDRFARDIKTAKRESQKLSLLILDLDNFKDVNDTLGHFAGDYLLVEVGKRINAILRDVDTIARIGGDEFSVLLPHTNKAQAIIAAKKILSVFQETIHITDVDIDVSISASIGISVYPFHGEDVDTLLRHADIAMYIAKKNKLGFEVYSEAQDIYSLSRLAMTRDFREAMANNKLQVNFQPIYDISGDKIITVEVLSRWEHPELGFISPEKFIPLAEQTRLINSLTYWVLEQSISQVSIWRKFNSELSVAVNVSVFSFKDSKFTTKVGALLEKYNFPSDKLKLEITESAMMDDPLHALDILNELHAMGIKLSIDDFGTGFSSMSYLQQFPVDELKIDKSFILDLDSNENNDAIVRSIIDLAHNLDLKVVAEGIESQKVHELLQGYNCDMAQGFYLSHPISAEKLETLLKSH